LIPYFLKGEKGLVGAMNIDLFLTGQSEAGIVCNASFPAPVIGVILDAQTQELTLEFSNGETFHLNIPIEESRREKLLFAHRMYVGFLEGGLLIDAFEVPLLYLNDPYGSEFGQATPLSKPERSIIAFEQFMKRCTFAQGLHRDNLGDEENARSILRGIDLHALQFAPALARQIQMNAIPRMDAVPQMPGLGGGAVRQMRVMPRIAKEEDKE
jgi:hypothetical protein